MSLFSIKTRAFVFCIRINCDTCEHRPVRGRAVMPKCRVKRVWWQHPTVAGVKNTRLSRAAAEGRERWQGS